MGALMVADSRVNIFAPVNITPYHCAMGEEHFILGYTAVGRRVDTDTPSRHMSPLICVPRSSSSEHRRWSICAAPLPCAMLYQPAQ